MTRALHMAGIVPLSAFVVAGGFLLPVEGFSPGLDADKSRWFSLCGRDLPDGRSTWCPLEVTCAACRRTRIFRDVRSYDAWASMCVAVDHPPEPFHERSHWWRQDLWRCAWLLQVRFPLPSPATQIGDEL